MRLNVLYQFNEKYVPYAGISMVSLMENSRTINEITIYALGENITAHSREKLTRQAGRYGRRIHFIDTEMIIDRIRRLGIPSYRGSYATNMKMFVTDYLDADIDRLLYIDSDTIICGDISPLISLDMEQKPIAMALDSLGGKYKLTIGLGEDDDYFNGGVILYDVKKWRQDKCTEKIQEHAKNVRACYVSPDQDLINVALKKQIRKLDLSYNLQPVHTVYTYRQYSREFGKKRYYSEEEVNAAVACPRILHTFRYLGEFPWHKDSLHPHMPYFDRYMGLSLWQDYQKQPAEQSGILFRIERLLYKSMPGPVFLKIFKISHRIFIWKSDKDLLKQAENTGDRDGRKQKIRIYVVGHKQFSMPVKDSAYMPLLVGEGYGDIPKGWLSDHTGENISDKNPRYNELTGLYWIWKNSDADIAGLCHYRRYFTTPAGKVRNVLTGKAAAWIGEEKIEKILRSHDVILHSKTLTPGGNRNRLCEKKKGTEAWGKSGLNRKMLDLMDRSFQKMYPEDCLFYEKVMGGRYAHLLNLMICRKEILDRYCAWLFPLLYEIEGEIDRQFPGQRHARCMGMIAERLLDVWVLKEGLRVKECFTVNTERRDWKPW